MIFWVCLAMGALLGAGLYITMQQPCRLLGCDESTIVDGEARRSYQKCARCGKESQYDFQVALLPDWIGFASGPNRCPLCMGWKPKASKYCAQRYCCLNPGFPGKIWN